MDNTLRDDVIPTSPVVDGNLKAVGHYVTEAREKNNWTL